MGKLNAEVVITSLYSGFAYVRDTAATMCGTPKPRYWFFDYSEYMDYGNFYFKINNKYNDATPYKIHISINKNDYEYYDALVEMLRSHVAWTFDISEYNYYMNKFYIIFKRSLGGSLKVHVYDVSDEGVNLVSDDFSRKIADYLYNDTICAYEASRDLLVANQTPTLSKPPIFNPPATICYWTDGTKTVIKCQEGDAYSPEAGLALCYMKKILGNTSKDLNKELHKYISEEEEE